MSDDDSDFVMSGSEDEDMVDGTQDYDDGGTSVVRSCYACAVLTMCVVACARDVDSTPDEVSDDEAFGMESMSSKAFGKSKANPYEVEHRSLSVEEIKASMNKDAEHIANLFEVDVSRLLYVLSMTGNAGTPSAILTIDVCLFASSVPPYFSSDT